MSTFAISYRITVLKGENINKKIEDICLEQSVEMPRPVLPEEVESKVPGKLISCEQAGETIFNVSISWPLANIGNEISQFFNVLYGNISLQPGIQVVGADWNVLHATLFDGPAFGIQSLRTKYAIKGRALSCTALKPLGTDASGFGELCYEFTAGGLDIIKDDHGLTDQSYAPFEERVMACVQGIEKAAEETGHRARYFPNITAFATDSMRRYELAAELGADGVLLCPHIAGMETMHKLARMDISLPIIAHPAFSGSFTINKNQGLASGFLYGELWRALGADFVIYPNTGGRFSFTPEECEAINLGARDEKLPFVRSFPMPAGGIKRSTIPHWLETYGTDTVFLLGSSLYEHPEGPRAAGRELIEMLT